MSSALDQLRADLRALRAAVERLERQNVRTGIVDRDEQRLGREVARAGMVEVSVPLDLYDPVGSSAGRAPADADYLVKTANATLTGERVVTDTVSIAADWSSAGLVKLNVVQPVRQVSGGDATCVSNEAVSVDTSAAVRNATLPATPADGDWVALQQLGPNVLTVLRNGKKINGAAANFPFAATLEAHTLRFDLATDSWFTF